MPVPFKRVMAANRGEIAIRIFRACTELGIQTVAVYSEEDRLSLHRYKADEAYLVGKGKAPIDAYLGIEEIVALAKRLEVDAIHPGYGFLSENAEFAEACERAGIVFIGPTAEMQRRLGDKVSGRRAAAAAGVPIVPGTAEPILHDEEALIFAKQHGYPIIVKASAGGGGRGMRVARSQKELVEGLVSARSEAKAAFGNAAVFLERYIERPKHIEVQILGDHHGNLVHLFERDCSIQRRHQKVVEFAPSLALGERQREAICEDALRIARSVSYRNAGTVEFLVDQEGRHYFIEVNPRIQVEHTVSEAITGRNLVTAQILVAEGKKLSDPEIGIAKQSDIQMRGCAIQCRITTEDPQNGFAPDFGVLQAYRSPGGFGVRLDAGSAYGGAVITPHYDSLLVKLTTWGLSLAAAAHIMDRALQEFRVRGVKTNISFLENVMRHPGFLAGRCDTSFIEAHPELLQAPVKKDRGTKLLKFLGEVIVNGSPAVTRPLNAAEPREARIPRPELGRRTPKGTRDLLLERGPEGLARWVLGEKRLLFTDTTWRDAHQSLLATRVRTHDLLRIAPATSHLAAGLFSLECWGGATFDVSMRFLQGGPLGAAPQAAPGGAEHPVPDAAARLERGRLHELPGQRGRAVRRGGGAERHRRVPRLRRAQLDAGDDRRVRRGPQAGEGPRGGALLHGRRLGSEARQVPARLLREARAGARADGRALPRHQGHGRAAQALRRGEAGPRAQGGGGPARPPPHA